MRLATERLGEAPLAEGQEIGPSHDAISKRSPCLVIGKGSLFLRNDVCAD